MQINFNSQKNQLFVIDHHFSDSNTENLADAKVICLGEDHNDINHRMANAWLINTLYREGDVIFTEDCNDNEAKNSSQAMFITKEANFRAWDISTETDLLDKIYGEEEDFSISYKLNNCRDEKWCKILREKFNTIPAKYEHSQTEFLRKLDSIENQPTNNTHYYKNLRHLINEYFSFWENNTFQDKIILSFKERNEMMWDVVKSCLKFYHRIFIIAGKDHFIKPKEWRSREEKIVVSESVDELKKELSSIPFVILDPVPTKERIDFLSHKLNKRGNYSNETIEPPTKRIKTMQLTN